MKIVYIMGLGRSGSTLLDVVLGNHPAMRSIGQFANFVRVGWISPNTCSCGQSSIDCPFWSSVRTRWHEYLANHSEPEYEAARQSYERMSRAAFTIPLSGLNANRFRFYLDSTVALYRTIVEACGGKTVVDSSKIPLRALHLSQVDEIDLRIIHLIRDARAAAFSWKKPGRDRNVTSTAIDWMASNLLSEWVLRRARIPSVRIRYEDFVEDPARALYSIGATIDENMDPVISQLLENRPVGVTHVAVGNRMRLASQIRLRPDTEWKGSMPVKEQRRVWAITRPLMVRYGYSRVASAEPGSEPLQALARGQDGTNPPHI